MANRIQRRIRTLVPLLMCLAPCGTALASTQDAAPAATALDSLFVVEISYPHDLMGNDAKTVRVQPGFLVDAEFGVTPLSGLIRHKAKALYFSSDRSASKFDVVGADPILDLAVIRVSTLRKAPAAAEASASISEAAPARAGLSEDSATDKPFDAGHAVLWVDLQSKRNPRRVELSEILDPSAEGEPLVFPSPQAGGLSGFPIVDAEDRLIGIWQWTWAESDSISPQFIPASAVRALVDRVRSDPDSKALDKLAALSRSSGFIPVLSWSGKGKSPQHGVERAKALRNQLRCSLCAGAGTKRVEEKDHKLRTTRSDVTCPGCQRSSVVGEQARWEKLRGLATEITSVTPTTEIERVAMALENGLREALDLNQSAILLSAYDGGKEELALSNLVPGRAIVLTVHRDYWPTQDQTLWGERVRVVNDPSYPSLLVRAPFARSTIGEGHVAWVTAVVAGPITVDGDTFVVLDRAIVVPVAAPTSFRAGR